MKEQFKRQVQKLLQAETGTVYKEKGGRINICLVYPNDYSVGMSSLGFQGIYSLLNDREDTVCERAFYSIDNLKVPPLSLESGRELADFDIIGFCLTFENDYPNVVKMLMSAKIPLKYYERTDKHPLLIAGGACCFYNPEPVAEIFDIIFVGEAEDSLNAFLDGFCIANKFKTLKYASNIEGIYCPSNPKPVKRVFKADLTQSKIKHKILSANCSFANMALVELMRGCKWNCKFCVVSTVYKPVRSKPLEVTFSEIKGFDSFTRIGLVGPSLSDYAEISQVLSLPNVAFSLTSIRASAQSLSLIKALKSKTISIAPEAGSQRLRDIIGKRISEADILNASACAFEAGIQTLRLYFMIGLPFERDEDITEIVNLVKKIKTHMPRNIAVTLSYFVPKPFTPLQYSAMQRPEVVIARANRIKKALLDVKACKVQFDDPQQALLQGLLARGQRRLLSLITHLASGKNFRQSLKLSDVDLDLEVFTELQNEKLAWDFIDNAVSQATLYCIWQKTALVGSSS